MNGASHFLIWSFALLSVLVASAFPLGLYWASRWLGVNAAGSFRVALAAAGGAILWLAFTFAGAASEVLTFSGTPPTMVLLIVAIIAIGIGLGLSRVGERLAIGLPLAALVGLHGFRFPLELIMHRAFDEGLMPVQMSYSGLNFDIVTGITAIVVAGLLVAGRMPTWGVRAWNWLGTVLLVNIMAIAILSTPTPFRVFMNEPANVWVTSAPFIWLPAVMVLTALFGHVVIFRRLRMEETKNSVRNEPPAAPASNLQAAAKS